MSLKFLPVVAVFEIEPIYTNNKDESLRFRIEVLLDPSLGSYFPRVYRWETFTVQPSFGQSIDENPQIQLADYGLPVRDSAIAWEELLFGSIDEVLHEFKKKLTELICSASSAASNSLTWSGEI